MSKLKIYTGSTWVDPTDVSVRIDNAWTSCDRVYYHDSGAWVEVWPLGTIELVADYALITIDCDDLVYPDLDWQVQSRWPDFMTPPASRGAINRSYINSSGGTVVYQGIKNPRYAWYPEAVNVQRLGRREKFFNWGRDNFSYDPSGEPNWPTILTNTYGANTISDQLVSRIGIESDYPILLDQDDYYRQVYIDFSNVFTAFPSTWANGSAWGSSYSTGNYRFTFYAGWPYDWAYDPADYPITFTIDLYKGGTLTRDGSTYVYSVTGYDEKKSFTVTHTASKKPSGVGTYASENQGLPADYAAFELIHDRATVSDPNPNVAVATSFTKSYTDATLPNWIVMQSTHSDATYTDRKLRTVYSIVDHTYFVDPVIIPTGIETAGRDLIIQGGYDTYGVSGSYPYDSVILGFQGLSNELDGYSANSTTSGQNLATETLSYEGTFGAITGDDQRPYPEKYLQQDNWWMDGFFADFVTKNQYSDQSCYFNIRQFQYDNPNIETVTIRIGAYWEQGSYESSDPVKLFVQGYDGELDGYRSSDGLIGGGTLIDTYGNISKVITANVAAGTASFGTAMANVVIDYGNNTVTVTSL